MNNTTSKVKRIPFDLFVDGRFQVNKNKYYWPAFFACTKLPITKIQQIDVPMEDAEESLRANNDISISMMRPEGIKGLIIHGPNGIYHDEMFGLQINTSNMKKAGKYLNRITRPVRYWLKDYGINVVIINSDDSYSDGLTKISPDIAIALGLKEDDCLDKASGQFTLINNEVFIKGHYQIDINLEPKTVVASKATIKTDILFDGEFISVEPVHEGTNVFMDIQSMLNLWAEKIIKPSTLIANLKASLQGMGDAIIQGKTEEILSRLQLDSDSTDGWRLSEVAKVKIPFLSSFTLTKSLIKTYVKSIVRIKEAHRIPLTDAVRVYVRPYVDKGFNPYTKLEENEIMLDGMGNMYVSYLGFDKFAKLHGGCDLDDSFVVWYMNEAKTKAVVWRNPNQLGAYSIVKVVPYVDAQKEVLHLREIKKSKKGIGTFNFEPKHYAYSIDNMIVAIREELLNKSNIGVAANMEMQKAAQFIEGFMPPAISWDLEKIIDSSVKDGADVAHEMQNIWMFQSALIAQCRIPASLLDRITAKNRAKATIMKNSKIDKFYKMMVTICNDWEKEMMVWAGKSCKMPVSMFDATYHPMGEMIRYNYGQKITRLIECYEAGLLDYSQFMSSIGDVQMDAVYELRSFTFTEKKNIMQYFANKIYGSSRYMHDSILWTNDTTFRTSEGLEMTVHGTVSYTIAMLQDLGYAARIEKYVHDVNVDECWDAIVGKDVEAKTFYSKKDKTSYRVERYFDKEALKIALKTVRIHTSMEVNPYAFDVKEMTVIGGAVYLAGMEFKLGDGYSLTDGDYNITIAPYRDKNNNLSTKSIVAVLN